MLRSFALPLLVAGLIVAGCTAEGEVDHDEVDETGQVTSALNDGEPVSLAVQTSCSTAVVKGLAQQLVEEIQCLRPGTMKKIDGEKGFNLGAAVFPYLQTPTADALVAAQKARNVTMTINSGLRTLPQQYLLYRWTQVGRCRDVVTLAAPPGTSNHESAIAIDVADNAGWRTALQGKGFRWLGAKDPVHYDFAGKGAVDLRGLSVQAFQRLWNRNHPDDKIGEDGKYGDETEKRLARSPANGFAIGAKCDGTQPATTPAPMPEPAGVPEGAEGEEPTTSADMTLPKSEKGDDDDDAPRTRKTSAAAEPEGCNMHGSSPGSFAPLALALGLVLSRRRRRAST